MSDVASNWKNLPFNPTEHDYIFLESRMDKVAMEREGLGTWYAVSKNGGHLAPTVSTSAGLWGNFIFLPGDVSQTHFFADTDPHVLEIQPRLAFEDN